MAKGQAVTVPHVSSFSPNLLTLFLALAQELPHRVSALLICLLETMNLTPASDQEWSPQQREHQAQCWTRDETHRLG